LGIFRLHKHSINIVGKAAAHVFGRWVSKDNGGTANYEHSTEKPSRIAC
jgi:hypothetical protein